MTTLLDALDDWSRRTPEAPLLRWAGSTESYAAVADASRRAGALFATEGVRPGDRVVTLLGNVPEYVHAVFGIYRLGAVLVPLNPLLRAEEIAATVRDCGAALVVAPDACDPGTLEALGSLGVRVVPASRLQAESGSAPDHGGPAAPSELGALLYTSATTGRSKGAMLSHAALRASADAYRSVLSLASSDVQVAFLPLFHSFGMCVVLNATIVGGGCVVLAGRFNPQMAVDLVADESVTVLTAITPMFAGMLVDVAGRPALPDFSALRLVGGGAAAIPPDLADRLVACLDAPIVQGWGLSETGASGTFTREARTLEAGDIGFPVPGIELRVVDDEGRDIADGERGELWIRGAALMSGYFGDAGATEAAFAPGGWLRTGDIGARRADGGYVFHDRAKEMIKRSGYNVYPAEVEAVLYRHPSVRLAAVIGIPSDQHGEEVVAAVVRRGDGPLDTAELREWVRGQVAPYKYPRQVVEFAELPLAPSGKILKRLIDRAPFAAGPVAGRVTA